MRTYAKKIDIFRHNLMVKVTENGTFPTPVDWNREGYHAIHHLAELGVWADAAKRHFPRGEKTYEAMRKHIDCIMAMFARAFPDDVKKIRTEYNKRLMQAEQDKAARESGVKKEEEHVSLAEALNKMFGEKKA